MNHAVSPHPDNPVAPRPWTGLDFACLGLLLAVTALALGPGLPLSGLGDPDEAAHAMDGVLIRDWLAAGPSAWLSPMDFARQQYGHYPTLGIGRHYPPGFAIVESAFFGLFGISVLSAKLCVFFFAGLAVIGLYTLLRLTAERGAACLAGLLFATLPATVEWGRQIMLELPTFAVAVWAAVAFVRYVDRPNVSRLIACITLAILGILFKQTALIVIGAVTIGVLWLALTRRASIWHGVACVLCSCTALVAVVLMLDDASMKTLSGYDSFAQRWGWEALTFHARHLPGLTGIVVLLLAAVGLLALRKLPSTVLVFLVGWFVLSYVMVTIASLKIPRFFYVGLFPIIVVAGLGAESLLRVLPSVRLQAVVAAAGAMGLTLSAWTYPTPQWPSYAGILDDLHPRMTGVPVLFSGLRDGDFVFAARQRMPWRQSLTIRGSKLFYTCTAGPDLDYVAYVESPTELIQRVRDFAFRLIVVERENHVGTAPDDWLRDYLASGGDYRRIASYPLSVRLPSHRIAPVTIDIYELTQPWTRQVDVYEIPMPRTGSPIRVDLSPFSQPAEAGTIASQHDELAAASRTSGSGVGLHE